MKNVLREPGPVQRVPPDEPAVRAGDDEIDLLRYVQTCWRYRYVLFAVAAVAGVVTYAINLRIQPTYEVGFRLMASEPRLGNEPTRSVSVVEYRELVESPSLVALLLGEFGLTGPPHNLTARGFLDSHVTVDVIRDTTIVSVAVRLKDRDLLVKLAQRYAERVVDLAQRLNTDGADYTAQRIKLERDAALGRLTVAEQSVEEFRRRAQIEVLQNEVETMLARRPEALDLTVQIQGQRARVRQIEAELGRQEKVRNVRRAVDGVPSARTTEDSPAPRTRPPSQPGTPRRGADQPGRRAEPNEPDDLSIRSELLDPYVNPVYEALERDLGNARTRLATLEEQLKELVSRLQLNAASAAQLNRLYEAETRLAALTRAQEVARAAYVNAANKYEDARLQSTARAPRLYILDSALPADRPVAPRSLRNTLSAVLLALTVAAIAVIAFDASRSRTDRRP